MSISLIAVGDISFGDSPKCFGFGVKRCVKKNGAGFIFEKIEGHLKSDILFGNLETVLSDEGLIPYDFHSDQMRGSVECIETLRHVGFNVLNVANNHMLEHGKKAFWDCITRLRENNIAVVGLKGSGEYFSEPAIVEFGRKVVGFLGYSFEEDNRLGYSADIAYAYCAEPARVVSDVHRLKRKVDFVIVSVHWGLEFAPYPSRNLVDIAHKIVDAGADSILGHHPHVVQCAEEYKEKTIYYSLGNFVFDMVWNKYCRRSMIAIFELQNNKIVQSKKYPVKITRKYQPVLDIDDMAQHYLECLDKEHSERVEIQGMNREIENLTYYRKVVVQQLKDTFLSNLFLLATIVVKTPILYLPGKLRYVAKKFF